MDKLSLSEHEELKQLRVLKEKAEKLKEYKRNYMRDYMYEKANPITRRKRLGPRVPKSTEQIPSN
jgi:hypothetical protein